MIDNRWIKQLSRYQRLVIAYSGGLDSTVLLHYLSSYPQLLQKLLAVHINHALSPHAELWEKHCRQFCQQLNVSFKSTHIEFNRTANIEEEARKARYQALEPFVKEGMCLLTGHQQDDQAETVLLHLMRGTGINGLAAMSDTLVFAQGFMHRPLLSISRDDLKEYADRHALAWINDESNLNVHFARNFIRQNVMPVLKSRWPAAAKTLSRASSLGQQAQANLDDLARIDYPDFDGDTAVFSLKSLYDLSDARLSNVLRYWLAQNKVRPLNFETFKRLTDELINSKIDACPEIHWDGYIIRRYQDTLYLELDKTPCLPQHTRWNTFPETLFIEGFGGLTANLSDQGITIVPDQCLDVRFRQGGEQFVWHGQTKSLKKLMQQWHIPPWQRAHVPLLYVDNQLAAVIGYAVSDAFYGQRNEKEFVYEISFIVCTGII